MIGNHGYADGRPAVPASPFSSDVVSMDIATSFCGSPPEARECGWTRTPAGVVGLVSPSSFRNRDSVDGCTTPRCGQQDSDPTYFFPA
eukprot:3310317-Pyramimonas_sp.AAC.1